MVPYYYNIIYYSLCIGRTLASGRPREYGFLRAVTAKTSIRYFFLFILFDHFPRQTDKQHRHCVKYNICVSAAW